MAQAQVKSVVTAPTSPAANLTPAQLLERVNAIRIRRAEEERQRKAEEADLAAFALLNAQKINSLEFEIFVNRALARVYQKAAYKALKELQGIDPMRRKVSFGKGGISKEYQSFIARFRKEVMTYPDARTVADPTDVSKIDADETDDTDSAG